MSLFTSFVGLWLTSYISNELEVILGLLLIFSFGICHGSNDILLLNTLSATKKNWFSTKVLSTYIATVIIALVVFYFLPTLALLLFIIFSGFHFGEQHWSVMPLIANITKKSLFYSIYGTLVLFVLLMCNFEETKAVVYAITGHFITVNMLYTISGILLGCYILFCLYIVKIDSSAKSTLLIEALYLLILAIIFKVSTLIWGFAIYFIFWHSIPSLFEQVHFLYGKPNFKNVVKYIKNALLYWIIALVGLFVLYYFFKDNTIFYGILFSFIAAVTFPHTVVMNSMFSNKKSTTK